MDLQTRIDEPVERQLSRPLRDGPGGGRGRVVLHQRGRAGELRGGHEARARLEEMEMDDVRPVLAEPEEQDERRPEDVGEGIADGRPAVSPLRDQ